MNSGLNTAQIALLLLLFALLIGARIIPRVIGNWWSKRKRRETEKDHQ